MPINIDLDKTKGQLEWLKTKLYLDAVSSNAKNRTVKRGQVYSCNLGIGIGSEMQKNRPCVIVQNDIANLKSPNTIIVPITHDKSTLPTMIPISAVTDATGNVILDGSANTSCIVCVSKARLGYYICDISAIDMKSIDESLAKSVDMMHYYAKLNSKVISQNNYITKIKQSRNDAEDKLNEIKTIIESSGSAESLITKIKKVFKTT